MRAGGFVCTWCLLGVCWVSAGCLASVGVSHMCAHSARASPKGRRRARRRTFLTDGQHVCACRRAEAWHLVTTDAKDPPRRPGIENLAIPGAKLPKQVGARRQAWACGCPQTGNRPYVRTSPDKSGQRATADTQKLTLFQNAHNYLAEYLFCWGGSCLPVPRMGT